MNFKINYTELFCCWIQIHYREVGRNTQRSSMSDMFRYVFCNLFQIQFCIIVLLGFPCFCVIELWRVNRLKVELLWESSCCCSTSMELFEIVKWDECFFLVIQSKGGWSCLTCEVHTLNFIRAMWIEFSFEVMNLTNFSYH